MKENQFCQIIQDLFKNQKYELLDYGSSRNVYDFSSSSVLKIDQNYLDYMEREYLSHSFSLDEIATSTNNFIEVESGFNDFCAQNQQELNLWKESSLPTIIKNILVPIYDNYENILLISEKMVPLLNWDDEMEYIDYFPSNPLKMKDILTSKLSNEKIKKITNFDSFCSGIAELYFLCGQESLDLITENIGIDPIDYSLRLIDSGYCNYQK